MRKILGGIFIALASFMLIVAPAINAYSQEGVTEPADPAPYCWGTLRIVAGIAVCDGAAYNCTHPCPPPPPPPPPIWVAGVLVSD